MAILAITAICTLYEELSFRRYLFKHQVFIIADCLPNFLAALLSIFAVVVIRKIKNNAEALRTSISITAGLTVYEVAQIWMPARVFDIKDIFASVLGGAVAYGVIYWINKLPD